MDCDSPNIGRSYIQMSEVWTQNIITNAQLWKLWETNEYGDKMSEEEKTIFTKENILQFILAIIGLFIFLSAGMVCLCVINNDTSIPILIMAIKMAGFMTGFSVCVMIIGTWFIREVGKR